MKCVRLLATLLAILPLAGSALALDFQPPISITSPDQATTYVFSDVKEHSLIWNKREGQLVAHLVFEELDRGGDASADDAHDFRLPGVSFDAAKGLFFATSARGELIPVAHIKKNLFFKSIETLPNAVVRIQRLHGTISVVLEAISPSDPAIHPSPAPVSSNPDPNGPHTVDIRQILN